LKLILSRENGALDMLFAQGLTTIGITGFNGLAAVNAEAAALPRTHVRCKLL